MRGANERFSNPYSGMEPVPVAYNIRIEQFIGRDSHTLGITSAQKTDETIKIDYSQSMFPYQFIKRCRVKMCAK